MPGVAGVVGGGPALCFASAAASVRNADRAVSTAVSRVTWSVARRARNSGGPATVAAGAATTAAEGVARLQPNSWARGDSMEET